ncbi:MAG: sulfur oxidation c-type cytochrome SoxX [Halothiobacillaceae bacterium]
MNKKHLMAMAIALALTRAACAEPTPDWGDKISEKEFLEAAKRSFYLNDPKEFDRLLDETLDVCNATKNRPSAEQAQAILKREQQAIVYPKDGKLFGDWKRGQKVVEEVHGGRIGYPGFADADDPHHPNGGNCHACHAIDPNFPQAGNMGPPLTNYGKFRPKNEAMIKYTYDKIYNAKASNPCSLMPRYGGPKHLLTPEQVADIVAFLLDPESPVNKPPIAAK